MNPLLFVGVDDIIQGIVTPVAISFGASIVRAALWGWHGTRHFIANTIVGMFGGVMAHWILSRFDFDPTMDAVIIACAAMVSKDAMQKIFSRHTIHYLGDAFKRRIEREILHRAAPKKDGE